MEGYGFALNPGAETVYTYWEGACNEVASYMYMSSNWYTYCPTTNNPLTTLLRSDKLPTSFLRSALHRRRTHTRRLYHTSLTASLARLMPAA